MVGSKILIAVFSLIVVCALIMLVAIGLRRLEDFRMPAKGSKLMAKSNRIQVVESKVIDARRKLLLVQVDGNEILLLVSSTSEQVIEIKPKKAAKV